MTSMCSTSSSYSEDSEAALGAPHHQISFQGNISKVIMKAILSHPSQTSYNDRGYIFLKKPQSLQRQIPLHDQNYHEEQKFLTEHSPGCKVRNKSKRACL